MYTRTTSQRYKHVYSFAKIPKDRYIVPSSKRIDSKMTTVNACQVPFSVHVQKCSNSKTCTCFFRRLPRYLMHVGKNDAFTSHDDMDFLLVMNPLCDSETI